MAVELGAAAIGCGMALALPFPHAVAGSVLGWLLLALALCDLEQWRLPFVLSGLLAAAGLASALLFPHPTLVDRLIGGLAGYGGLSLIRLVYARLRGRDGMGGGDPPLLGALGLWFGWAALPLLLLGASLLGLVLVFVKIRHYDGQARVPFGALLAVVAIPLWVMQNIPNALTFGMSFSNMV